MKKIRIKILVFFVVSFGFYSSNLSAQPNNPPPEDPDVVPITGIEWLLVGGGLLGGYRILNKKNIEK